MSHENHSFGSLTAAVAALLFAGVMPGLAQQHSPGKQTPKNEACCAIDVSAFPQANSPGRGEEHHDSSAGEWQNPAGHAAHSHHAERNEVMVGKSAEITLEEAVRAGEAILPAGRYRIQDRVEHGGHSLRFIPITGNGDAVKPIDIKCKLQPLVGEIPETLLRLRRQRDGYVLLKVLVRGESAAHIF